MTSFRGIRSSDSVAILGSRGYPSTYGGFETLVRRLAPYLRRHDLCVSVYARGGIRRTRRRVDAEAGISVIFTPGIDTKSASTLTHGLTASWDLRKQNCRAALVLNVANGFFLSQLRSAGIRTVVNVDGLEWQRGKWGGLAKSVFRVGATVAARHADVLVADSGGIARHWEANFHRSMVYLPYGADVILDYPATRLAEFGLRPGYLLFVARIVPENNIGLFLDALERLPVQTPVVVVGDSNYSSCDTHRLEDLRSKRPNFRWLGHMADQDLLNCLWAHCGVYFHGHSVGGTNPALLQAMGLRAPVVAFDSEFNREVLGDGGLFVGRESRALAEVLGTVISDHGHLDGMRDRAVDRVARYYRWERVCEGYRELLTTGRLDHGDPIPPYVGGSAQDVLRPAR